MICISSTPESRQLAKVDLLNASRQADLIELCLDHLIKEPDVGDLLKDAKKPVLVSCRRVQDGGKFKGTEDERMALLRQAIVAGPAYVELDVDAAAKIPRFGDTKRVVSHTRLDRPLGNVDELFDQAYKAKADVVKFTWPTPTLDAAWPLLAAVTKKRDLPVVGMGLGRAGVTFSLLGLRYGSPWVYAALEKGMEAHEGQAAVADLEDVYHWSEINANTRFVGMVGMGTGETLAVQIFNAGFQRLGLKHRCLPLVLGRFDKLGQMLDILHVQAVVVGLPLAAHLAEFATHSEEAASGARFTDLILKSPEGWHGYNLVWRGVLRAIEDKLGRKNSEDRPLDRRNVLIIGTNATASAVAYGALRRKGVISITGPDQAKSQEIAQKFNIRCVPFANLYDTLADVAIITDPAIAVGHGKTDMNPTYLRSHMTVADVSRLPEETEFISQARQRGCKTVEPRDLFVDHLGSQFKSACGHDLPPDAITDVLAP